VDQNTSRVTLTANQVQPVCGILAFDILTRQASSYRTIVQHCTSIPRYPPVFCATQSRVRFSYPLRANHIQPFARNVYVGSFSQMDDVTGARIRQIEHAIR
jgi:hypothetical protein